MSGIFITIALQAFLLLGQRVASQVTPSPACANATTQQQTACSGAANDSAVLCSGDCREAIVYTLSVCDPEAS